MAGCPVYASTSEEAIYYTVDPDPALPLPGTLSWYSIPITSESLNATLSSTISEQITPQRSYSGSKLTQGEVGGQFGFELQASPLLNNMFIAALQADQALDLGTDLVAGTAGVVISAVGTLVDDDRTINLTGLTATEGATYSVIIDGENFNYVAGATPTVDSIATALAALIDADTVYVATAATGTITISAGAGLSVISFTSFTPAAWAPGEALVNGSTKKCLAFLKLIKVGDTTYDQYVFRGCQISGVSLDMKPGALLTGSVTLMGIRPDTPTEASALPVGWTMVAAPSLPLMSAVDSLEDLQVQTSAGVDTGATFSDFTLTMDNQLRQQQAIGLGHPFAAGVASGRFMASCSGTVYYANPRVYNDFLNDASLKIVAQLRDSEGSGYNILMNFVKVTSGSLPEAGGPDQDLTVATEFRAFQDPTYGTIQITRVAA